MSFNFESAFDLDEDGAVIRDQDGNLQFYLAAGSLSPLGQSAPINTLYVQGALDKLWRKIGPNDHDWLLVRAFNPVVIDDFQIVPSNEEMAIGNKLVIEQNGTLRVDGRTFVFTED